MLTGGQVAGLIVAVFWALLVCFLAYVLVKLARLLTETTTVVKDIGERTPPLLDHLTSTVAEANAQLSRVDAITDNVTTVTANVAKVTSVFSATLGGPLVRVAGLAYGLRRAVTGRRRRETERRVKSEMKAERKSRR